MLKVEGGTHFLVVIPGTDSTDVAVRSYARFADAVSSNGPVRDYRLSPIFPINKAPPPTFSSVDESTLIFLGPVYPGLLDFKDAPHIYLTLGTYNVLCWCQTKEQHDEVLEFAENTEIPTEIWSLKGEQVETQKISFSWPEMGRKHSPVDVALDVPQELSISAREYQLLIQRAVVDADIYWPEQKERLLNFNRGFCDLINSEQEDLGKLTSLVITNAGLSRFISQAYAGTSPILRRECNYTPNSMLGIGLANQVLCVLESFAGDVFAENKLITRLKYLSELDPESEPIYEMDGSDLFFQTDFLFSHRVNEKIEASPEVYTVPNITCFSGRDGFRATRYTLSAPLEVISGANTYEWTLLTLTHEISHIAIEGVLGAFFPRVNEEASVARWLGIINGDFQAGSLFDQAEELLLYGFCMLFAEFNQNDAFPENAAEVTECIERHSPEANEILTHIFDFLYFYQGDEELYVKSVWSSWAVIPNIEARIYQYIQRTLCALYSARMAFPIEATFEAFESQLKLLIENNEEKATVAIAQKALEMLSSCAEEFDEGVNNRIPFAKFVSAFLFSPAIADCLTGDIGPKIPTLGFRREEITNPLAFLKKYANEHRPQIMKSVWMLQNLAFCRK